MAQNMKHLLPTRFYLLVGAPTVLFSGVVLIDRGWMCSVMFGVGASTSVEWLTATALDR